MVEVRQPRLAVHPWLLAAIVSSGIGFVAIVLVVPLQSFTISDTRCYGTISRLLHGGPFTSGDGVCRHAETVRFAWSLFLVAGAAALIAITVVASRRAARRGADDRQRHS